MARRMKPRDLVAVAEKGPAQHIPPGPIKADMAAMMPNYPKRHDGWNHERLQRFLDTLAHTGCVADGCRVAGMSDKAVLRARKVYPLFAKACAEAIGLSLPGLIAIAYRRAVEGTETIIIRKGEEVERRISPSDAILQALLKRGDLQNAGAAINPDGAITLEEWNDRWRFNHWGEKFQAEAEDAAQKRFHAKIDLMRQRNEENCRAGGKCPRCRQTLPLGPDSRSMAELVASGVVALEDLMDEEDLV